MSCLLMIFGCSTIWPFRPPNWKVPAGDCVARLLSQAHAAIAREARFSKLTSEPDHWVDYQGGIYMAEPWAGTHMIEVRGFIKAYLDAVDWIFGPGNLDHLPGLLMRHLPHMNEEAVARAARALHSSGALLQVGMPLNMSGLARVMELRHKYGTLPASLGRVEKYLDFSCYDQVMASRG